MKTRFRVFVIFAGVILGLAPIQTHTADGQPLRVAYTSIAISYGPLWLTKEAGIFKKHNLDADLLALPQRVTPQRFVERRFVCDLVSTGFVDSLYKSH